MTKPSNPTMDDRWRYATSTYRYLRLSIVVVIATLGVSIVDQYIKQRCLQGSVSAFYYTPVHSVFIAALALIGVALIAIRGSNWKQETLLNIAGFLAPVVAFVPTARPSAKTLRCPIDDVFGTIPPGFVDNNLRAFVIGGLLALMFVLIPVLITHKENHGARGWVHKETVIPALGAALILGAGMLWHRHRPESFRLHAHSYSAILMFVLTGMFVFSTARSTLGPLRHIYYGCAALMIVGFVIGVIAANHYYTVLVVETIESAAFVTFWAVQSVEMWDRGLNSTTGTQRPPTTVA